MRDNSTFEITATIESDDLITLGLLRDRLERERIGILKAQTKSYGYQYPRNTDLDPDIAALNRILEQVKK